MCSATAAIFLYNYIPRGIKRLLPYTVQYKDIILKDNII